MSKKRPDRPVSSAPEKSPSKEGWISRHRGKIALILGLAIGAIYRPIIQGTLEAFWHISQMTCSAPTKNPTHSKLNPFKIKKKIKSGLDPFEEDIKSEPEPIEEAVLKMPSPCELREGTFLADSHEFDKFCEGGQIKEGSDCMRGDEFERKHYIESIRKTAISVLREGAEAEERGKTDDHSTFDLIDLSQLVRTDIGDCREFKTLPDSYKTFLRDFDPVLYDSLKDRVYLERNDMLGIYGHGGSAEGPYSVIQNRLVPSPYGKTYKVTLSGEVELGTAIDAILIGAEKINNKKKLDIPNSLDEALKSKNRTQIANFLYALSALAHEIYGHTALADKHLVDVSGRKPQSLEEIYQTVLPEVARNELYAYFISAKMLLFVAEKHPEIDAMLHESYAERETIEWLKHEAIICDDYESVKDFESEMRTEMQLARMSEHFEAYLNAMGTGDWRPFKDMILTKILFQQFGLPYLLPYLRNQEKQDYFLSLNRDFEAMMNEDSPENLFRE